MEQCYQQLCWCVTAKLSCLPCMNEEAPFAAPCDPHCVIKVQPVHKCLVCTLVPVAAKREGYPAARGTM